MIHTAIVSLGSNIDKEQNLSTAVTKLAALVNVVDVSSVYETLPIGTAPQENYLNAAVLIHTPLSAEVLRRGPLTEIEQALRRVRSEDKFAPRTIDLDISWYDGTAFDYPGPDGLPRHVPDPDLLRFVHVAVPVAELLPDGTLYPGRTEKVRSISERLLNAPTPTGQPTIWPRPDLDLRQFLSPTTRD